MSSGRIVAITGASSGIGAALALEAAAEGARVALMARRIDELEEIARQVRDRGGEAMVTPLDVSNHDQVLKTFQNIEEEWGLPDVVIANAGIGRPSSVTNMKMQEIESLFQVNFFGVLYTADAVIGKMVERGSGRFAAVSSLGRAIFQEVHVRDNIIAAEQVDKQVAERNMSRCGGDGDDTQTQSNCA